MITLSVITLSGSFYIFITKITLIVNGLWPSGCGSNHGTVYWKDVIKSSYFVINKNRNKGSQLGHSKKQLKKPTLIVFFI
jgi:hypothetical protein